MASPSDTWKRWHPIVRAIAQKLVKRDDPHLTADELDEIRTELAKLYDRDALEPAVRDLLYLAAALEHQGHAALAARLFAIVETKPVLGALDTIHRVRAIDRAEEVNAAAKRFAFFSRRSLEMPKLPDPKDSGPPGLRLRDLKPTRIAG